MPTYEYRREDGTRFEIEQRITEPALRICPTTGQPVTRLISAGAGLVFKGSGFYLTDYARSGSRSTDTAPKSPANSEKSESDTKASDKPAKAETESSAKKD